MKESHQAHRLVQTRFLATRLQEAGIPAIQPAGGHEVYVEAGALLHHLPPHEYPGQALSLELYLAGGVRVATVG